MPPMLVASLLLNLGFMRASARLQLSAVHIRCKSLSGLRHHCTACFCCSHVSRLGVESLRALLSCLVSGWAGTTMQRPRHAALQLDIDNGPVEQALMEQIGDDPELQGLISEMFFEQHFDDAAVRARPPRWRLHIR